MKPQNISLGIKKIKDIEFFVDESLEVNDYKNVNINFEVTTSIKEDDLTVELIVTTTYTEIATNKLFLKIKVSNVFVIPELLSIPQPTKDTISLPDAIVVTMLSISISHTRALLAKNAVGTKFHDAYIPIVNPTDLATQLFGIGKS